MYVCIRVFIINSLFILCVCVCGVERERERERARERERGRDYVELLNTRSLANPWLHTYTPPHALMHAHTHTHTHTHTHRLWPYHRDTHN